MPSAVGPKTGSRAKRARTTAEAFRFEGERVRPGTSRQLEIPVARVPGGSWASMPVVVVHGARPGPVVWVNGAIHGDELNGIEICRLLLGRLDPRKLSGTVLVVPAVNVFGVANSSRYLPDRRDLNRSFPGSKRGSLAARLAHLFFSLIAERCEVGIDFHTGSAGRKNLPHIRCALDDPETHRLAHAFHPPLLVDSTLRDGSLRAAAAQRDIRVLLFEVGEAARFDEDGIAGGIVGALRVFAALGMVEDAPRPPAGEPWIARSTKWMRASRSGFCHIRVELGQRVAVGDRVATIIDDVGGRGGPVRSHVAGIVIGVLRTALVHRGDAVVHIAEVEE